MSINEVIVWILMICMALGGIDRAIGNKFGLGEKFEEGFNAMGPLALSMVGVYALSPVLAKLLGPIVKPIYGLIGADPAMFAGTLLANDMGGWPLAQQLTDDPNAQMLSGLILGAMMGATVVFTIPVALGIIKVDDRTYLAKGVLAGIVTIPFGVVTSGLVAGMPIGFVLINTVPIIVAAALIAVGLWLIPDGMTKGFLWFGKGLVFIISIGLVIGVFETLTEVQIMPAGWELLPVTEGLAIVGSIGMMLLGAFPAVHLIVTFGAKPLAAVGRLIGVNKSAAGGFIATLANNIAMFEIMKDMDKRGKILNAAFAVSAAFVLGDHLGFTAGVAREMIAPMIAGKLVAGILAVVVALLLFARAFPGVSAADEAAAEEPVEAAAAEEA
ncbi:ethanolamine utilization protein EutH [Tessaracoccus defluvii]|uniref:Ethanolamine utilization protein EutH n=1 Tax=Tessaracoccus defluvii TaxID=1285901 RepID=A0A7H0H744_9ACTN|nr:ethanolamine utilization protein EutH [Tessaracoccus defluvii]QNP56360.1 ethanolamine utilization protein EutH [Tessaracoccus defluvii]